MTRLNLSPLSRIIHDTDRWKHASQRRRCLDHDLTMCLSILSRIKIVLSTLSQIPLQAHMRRIKDVSTHDNYRDSIMLDSSRALSRLCICIYLSIYPLRSASVTCVKRTERERERRSLALHHITWHHDGYRRSAILIWKWIHIGRAQFQASGNSSHPWLGRTLLTSDATPGADVDGECENHLLSLTLCCPSRPSIWKRAIAVDLCVPNGWHSILSKNYSSKNNSKKLSLRCPILTSSFCRKPSWMSLWKMCQTVIRFVCWWKICGIFVWLSYVLRLGIWRAVVPCMQKWPIWHKWKSVWSGTFWRRRWNTSLSCRMQYQKSRNKPRIFFDF